VKGRLYRLGKEEQARIESQLRTVLEREPDIAFAYLYGSFLESGTFHDVDVGIYMTASSAVREADQALQLAHRLSEETGLPIDIRIVNHAPVSFQYHVLKGRLLLAHDPDLLAAVMESVVRQYLDMAPLLRWATREAFAG
jgi:predicted nucleotidyltransferase